MLLERIRSVAHKTPIFKVILSVRRFLSTSPNSSRVHLRAWIEQAAAVAPQGAMVLDAGAGIGPYRQLFAHTNYETADFAQVDKPYGDLTYTCALTSIPVADGRFDLVLLNQVLEHIPDPIAVLAELHRTMKRDATLWACAPLFYAEHEQPYDFFRYTQFAWRDMAERSGFKIVDMAWLEGYDGTLSYQLSMAARELPNMLWPLRLLFAVLARYFYRRDVRRPDVSRGMCKNYRCVLKPV